MKAAYQASTAPDTYNEGSKRSRHVESRHEERDTHRTFHDNKTEDTARENALTKLRQGQIYDETEDVDTVTFEDVKTYRNDDGNKSQGRRPLDEIRQSQSCDSADTETEEISQRSTEEQEKQVALEKTRQGQTYDEQEAVFDKIYDEKYSWEAYNKAREKYVFFWKNADIYSQWNKRHPFYIDNNEFNCAEQFMMYRKAVLFNDEEVGNEILCCKDPRKIKALGRKVSGFKREIWDQNCLQIVKEGNMAKFSQNVDYLAELLFTYPYLLVEASPYDSIWGIGLTEDAPDAWDESTWQGTNYLGYIITEVRDDIMVKRGMIDETDRVKHVDRLLAQAGYPPTNKTIEQVQDPDEYHVFSHGIYSQWHTAYFMVGDTRFCCAEQYMMYQKALLFGDSENAKKILETNNPKKMKEYGRHVKGFDNKTWAGHCLRIVKEGNKAKFSQNPRLQMEIVTTYPKIFVEANPGDKLWGIGRKADKNAQNKSLWRGKNWLGYVLTEVRDELFVYWGLLKKEKAVNYTAQLLEEWDTSVDIGNHHEYDEAADRDAKRGVGKTKEEEFPYQNVLAQDKRDKNPVKPKQRNTKEKHKIEHEVSHSGKENMKHGGSGQIKKWEDEYQAEQRAIKERSRRGTTSEELSTEVETEVQPNNAESHYSSIYDHSTTPDDTVQIKSKKKKTKKGRKDLHNSESLSEEICDRKQPETCNKDKEWSKKTTNESSDKPCSQTDVSSDHEKIGKVNQNDKKPNEKSKNADLTTERIPGAHNIDVNESRDSKLETEIAGTSDLEHGHSDTMSNSQKMKREKSKRGKQQSQAQSDAQAEDKEEDHACKQLSRRQRKNLKKK